ncbi:Hypothetical predicted protein [Octopus vulgaris]|uniref:Uncharacterized protein n=1 Tax=Octopus vulgaris TaxID=6645 RepID=A0AA36F4K4_OCTVU|nr:Hypothetical predicted protein [Octopus vulgaris]
MENVVCLNIDGKDERILDECYDTKNTITKICKELSSDWKSILPTLSVTSEVVESSAQFTNVLIATSVHHSFHITTLLYYLMTLRY